MSKMDLRYTYEEQDGLNNALKLASIRLGYTIDNYDKDSNYVYPLDINGNRVLVDDNNQINIAHLEGWNVLGDDPLIIVAVMSLYSDGIIPQVCLTNFLNVCHDEIFADPFQRIDKVFMCSDPLVSSYIGSKIKQLIQLESWHGFYVQTDDVTNINQFIRKWFIEASSFTGNINNGSKITWLVFRDRQIPYLDINDVQTFILSNYANNKVILPFYYPSIGINYLDIRFKYAFELSNQQRINQFRCLGSNIHFSLTQEDSGGLPILDMNLNSIISRVFVHRMDYIDALLIRYRLRELFQTFIVINNNYCYLIIDGDYRESLAITMDDIRNLKHALGNNGESGDNNVYSDLELLINNNDDPLHELRLYGYIAWLNVPGIIFSS